MNAGAPVARARGWPLSPATVRAVLSGHGLLGLAFAALIYLVCVSGTLAVFAHDLQRWEQPHAPVAPALDPPALERALAAAARRAPAEATFYVSLPGGAVPGAAVFADAPDFEQEWAIAADGTLTSRETPFADFLVELHVALHLPHSWGRFVVGLAGVALLSSLVSGVLAHPRVFRDAFHLRLGGSRRLQEADLHNRLGVWAMPFHLMIALTGALLGLSTIIVGVLALLVYRGDTDRVYDMFIDPPPPANAAPMRLPPLAPLLAEAARRAPGATPVQLVVSHPGRADARVTVSSARPALIVAQDSTVFDAAGRVVKDEHPAGSVFGTRLLGGIGQLHFGWFGGVAVRLLYGLLGAALCWVTATGVTIWLARRRDKGRPVPQWERLWAAVAWGQPLALALVGLLAIAVPVGGGALVWTWLGLTALLLAAAAVAPPVARLLPVPFGLALALLGVLHAPIVGGGALALGFDAALLAAGASLAWRRRPATGR